MRPIPTRLEKVNADAVRKKVREQEGRVDKQVANIVYWNDLTDSLETLVSPALTIVSGLAFFITIIVAISPSRVYPLVWVLIALGGLGAAFSIWLSRQLTDEKTKMQNKKREQLLSILEKDVLYQRGQLVVRALDEYYDHIARYKKWYELAMIEELEGPDEEGAAQYFQFLERSYITLGKAVSNFELALRRIKHEKASCQIQEVSSVNLSNLLAELNASVTLPPEHSFDPIEALHDTERLTEAFQELDLSGKALAAELDALESPKDLPDPPVSE